ncbi:putative sulfate transporter 4.2 [Salvia divinorum]|uniref:Sulfate transporter 4.2 n=1 Tax=Salvia divinorum TaxID=28513 RepID=A0ABD1GGS3_SALDI
MFVLYYNTVIYIDSSAVQALKDLYHEYRSRNNQIAISNPNRDVLLTLTKAEVVDLIGRECPHCWSLFNRLLKQCSEEAALSHLESGTREIASSRDETSHLEPLLSKKT